MPVDMASMAWHALTLLLEPSRLGILFIGVVIGLSIGVLPGLNGSMPGGRTSPPPPCESSSR